jgi:hypothetical protein
MQLVRMTGLLILLLFSAQGRPAPAKVNSTYDKTAAFATFNTYRWVAGQPAFDPGAHKAIVAAIDAQMAALGLKQAEAKSADVTLRYLAVRSTSVDLEKLEALKKQGGDTAGADFTVGRLVVVMEEATSNRRLWAADGVERLNPAVAERDQAIAAVVARLFETYPIRQKAK